MKVARHIFGFFLLRSQKDFRGFFSRGVLNVSAMTVCCQADIVYLSWILHRRLSLGTPRPVPTAVTGSIASNLSSWGGQPSSHIDTQTSSFLLSPLRTLALKDDLFSAPPVAESMYLLWKHLEGPLKAVSGLNCSQTFHCNGAFSRGWHLKFLKGVTALFVCFQECNIFIVSYS